MWFERLTAAPSYAVSDCRNSVFEASVSLLDGTLLARPNGRNQCESKRGAPSLSASSGLRISKLLKHETLGDHFEWPEVIRAAEII